MKIIDYGKFYCLPKKIAIQRLSVWLIFHVSQMYSDLITNLELRV